jgi:hypothetical protein
MTDFDMKKQEMLEQLDTLTKWNDENKQAIEQVRINIETIMRVLEVVSRMK